MISKEFLKENVNISYYDLDKMMTHLHIVQLLTGQ